ncbi:MAG TPA: aldo/keto reductase [Burkholderiales bacterium]|nr:aldo/keto reductase [Burkholderiales bacterium]
MVRADNDRVTLGATGISTSRLAFGCGSLMRLSRRRERMSVLAAAFDAGIRHFDVAPMYGLGQAERELGAFLGSRRGEVTIATKFGITLRRPTLGMGKLQGIARGLIKRFPALRRHAASRAGALYLPKNFDPGAAAASLERSLADLGVDAVDLLLMHEPETTLIWPGPLLEWLERERARGRVRAFGGAGYVPKVTDVARQFPELMEIVQADSDLVHGQIETLKALGKPLITFSPLSRALDVLQRCCSERPAIASDIRDATGYDLRGADALAHVLFSFALRANSEGVVLFSSLRPERIAQAARWASGDAVPDSALQYIAGALRLAHAERAAPGERSC